MSSFGPFDKRVLFHIVDWVIKITMNRYTIGCDTFPDANFDVIINLSDQPEDPALEPKKFMKLFHPQKKKKSGQIKVEIL